MRKLVGGIVLVTGVGGLGWYAHGNHAERMEAEVASAAQATAQTFGSPINATVSGRDITITGQASGEAERAEILAAMNAIDGRRVVHDDLQVLDTVSPFALNAVKNAESITYSGVIPSVAAREALATRIGDGANELSIKGGAPDDSWTGVVDQGLDGLDALQTGTLSVSDRDITLTGVALNPDQDAQARAPLATLPEGYTTQFDIDVLGDGSPFRLAMEKTADGTVASSGKIPSALDISDLSAALDANVSDENILQEDLAPELAAWPDVARTGASALAQLRSGNMQLTEDTLRVTGVATPEGKAQAEAMLADMPEGMTATSEITIYDDGQPFSLAMTKTADGTTASGKFPAGLAAGDIIGDVPAGDVENAFIEAENGGFATASAAGVQALSLTEEGTLSVIDTDVRLTGIARTPAEVDAATGLLADLPEGFNATVDLTARDDGMPPVFDVRYTPADGASVSGKLPVGIATADVAGALNLATVDGAPVLGLTGENSNAQAQLEAVSQWLPQLDMLHFNSNNDVVTIEAIASDGVDQDLVQAQMQDALGAATTVTVTGTFAPEPVVVAPAINADDCNDNSANAINDNPINFVTLSAELDGQSMQTIDALADIFAACLADGSLTVEIGGHTDSRGSDDLNMNLSQARAESVRTALVDRGVPADAIVSTGYGETQPIANNATEEGRAANRRTTINWLTDPADGDAVQTETNTEVGE